MALDCGYDYPIQEGAQVLSIPKGQVIQVYTISHLYYCATPWSSGPCAGPDPTRTYPIDSASTSASASTAAAAAAASASASPWWILVGAPPVKKILRRGRKDCTHISPTLQLQEDRL